jgi:hypothetical protein
LLEPDPEPGSPDLNNTAMAAGIGEMVLLFMVLLGSFNTWQYDES